MNLRFGLDIGVASVGWAVVNDEYEVLESGSNIFESANASQNVERRSYRQTKRLLRRRRNRVLDFNKLWEKSGLSIPKNNYNNQLELRVQGVSKPLTVDELYHVLTNMLRHRGISYLEDALDETTIGKSDYERGLKQNQEALKQKFPCEIQMERLIENGKYRGKTEAFDTDGDLITLSNVFTINSYVAELKRLFEIQKEYHNFIDESFENEYFSIFNRKREYYDGPGNEKSRTDYGKYTTKRDEVTGEFITEDNIFEKLIGKCSVYSDERRAAGASYTAQEFNLLNDLNNLTVNGRKLSEKEKREIIQKVVTSNTVNIRNIIKKVIKEDIETFTGARIDKDEKEIFHKFEQYNKLRKSFEADGIDIKAFSVEDLDEIGEILTLNPDKEAIIKAVLKAQSGGRLLSCNDEIVGRLSSFRKKNSSLFSKWQSFSLKVMREMIPELYTTSENQMQILTRWGVFKSNIDKYKEYNKIPAEELLKEIYNPVVKRSVRVAVDIVNALIKKYGYPQEIVVEMPRDRNSDEQKKRIKDLQKKNEKELKDIKARIESEYGREITGKDFVNNDKLSLKLKLWNEQDGICPYSGKSISIYDLLDNRFLFEIDHIIPRSISFDDSRSNKVLVYSEENQKKGNKTPYMYLNGIHREWNYDAFLQHVRDLQKKKKVNKNKADKLLMTDDITKIEVMKGFISRNINDTRYASRVILNTLQDYFRAKDCSTKVKVVRGAFTHQMRVNLKLPKDREESFAHHAVDAMLICYSQMGYEAYKKFQEEFIDLETGEILDMEKWNSGMNDDQYADKLYNEKLYRMKANIARAEKNVKYWYKVDRKPNRQISNQTIRGTREFGGKTYKINKLNIYDQNGFKTLQTLINKGQQDRILMYKHDQKSFEQLMQVYEAYQDAANPFTAYHQETGDYVRRYAKKHNGPKIETLKYTDGEVGAHIDISHKYGHSRGSKKVILESLKPYRMDVYYRPEDGTYHFVGLKYADFKYEKGKYCISEEAYTKALIGENVIQPGKNRNDLEELGYQFKLSFYKNEILRYEKNGEYYEERFLSRTMPKSKNYIESKPVDSSKFEKQNLVGLAKTKAVIKVRTDILGNKYYCKEEKFRL